MMMHPRDTVVPSCPFHKRRPAVDGPRTRSRPRWSAAAHRSAPDWDCGHDPWQSNDWGAHGDAPRHNDGCPPAQLVLAFEGWVSEHTSGVGDPEPYGWDTLAIRGYFSWFIVCQRRNHSQNPLPVTPPGNHSQ